MDDCLYIFQTKSKTLYIIYHCNDRRLTGRLGHQNFYLSFCCAHNIFLKKNKNKQYSE